LTVEIRVYDVDVGTVGDFALLLSPGLVGRVRQFARKRT
jgi:hypothetical protein